MFGAQPILLVAGEALASDVADAAAEMDGPVRSIVRLVNPQIHAAQIASDTYKKIYTSVLGKAPLARSARLHREMVG
jgi:hypothetical protein